MTYADQAFFRRVFFIDLAPFQDDAKTGAEVVSMAREVVAHHMANEPEENVVDADEAPAFLAWIDANAGRLSSECAR